MVAVKAVIGKNFGDEGKGQTVDRLCRENREKRVLVIRHNGGAQAGHTVEDRDFRFVFHQLGSGSHQGCPTYWCRTFLPDLLKLGEEMADMKQAGMSIRTVYAHPDCACVTVYDVLLNSLTEQLRGRDRHGSCGMGIFETVLRTENAPFALFLRDLANMTKDEAEIRIREKLCHIRDKYTLPRLAELKKEYPDAFRDPDICQWVERITDDNLLYNAAGIMCENYSRYVTLADWPPMASQFDVLIFENGQGLMLDWDNEEYAPHLTASHTGLKNVAELLAEPEGSGSFEPDDNSDKPGLSAPVYTLEVIYVTRTYVTRHGAGRLAHECSKETVCPKMTDRTNVFNPWQEHLRYGKHPIGEDFFRYIRKDLEHLKQALPHHPFSVSLYLTHLDETQGRMLFADGDRKFEDFCRYCRDNAPGLFQDIHRMNSPCTAPG
ncbi:MAG: adenylosuccinate synthetase [Acetatifactor sp.]|nr:adenylosuccinate synthetase [Acetatifactor sp.]